METNLQHHQEDLELVLKALLSNDKSTVRKKNLEIWKIRIAN